MNHLITPVISKNDIELDPNSFDALRSRRIFLRQRIDLAPKLRKLSENGWQVGHFFAKMTPYIFSDNGPLYLINPIQNLYFGRIELCVP